MPVLGLSKTRRLDEPIAASLKTLAPADHFYHLYTLHPARSGRHAVAFPDYIAGRLRSRVRYLLEACGAYIGTPDLGWPQVVQFTS